jgi:hypothetical protein
MFALLVPSLLTSLFRAHLVDKCEIFACVGLILPLISGENAFVKHKPGICFTEKMVGKFCKSESRDEETSCEFTLTIESNDVKAMLEFDPDHAAQISGTVTCPALSSSPLTVFEG